ncbi:MAG: hypothetical protein AAF821_04775 [Cyanobacteria bacterium P01_D01_bin.156]
MPFLPLFVVIGIFLAASKILQPKQQQAESTVKEYDERMLNQALIDYIAREARHQPKSSKASKV